MFSIEKQVDISAARQVLGSGNHSARITLAERGGRAIMRVLSKDARVVSVSAVMAGADVDVAGKVVCTAVCEIAGGEIVCLEYLGNFNFNHKVAGLATPCVCDVAALVSAVRVIRASGCEVVCEVDFAVRENFSVQGGESAVVSAAACYSETEKFKATSAAVKVYNFTALAEMEVLAEAKTVLSQQFFAETTSVSVRGGSCVVAGNIHGFVCFQGGDGAVKNQACSFPFREEFSCADADDFAAFVRVCEHNLVCEVNEVRGISVVTCEVELEISLWGFTAAEFEKGGNFFSDKVEISEVATDFCWGEFGGALQSAGKFSSAFAWPFDLPSDVCVCSARVCEVKRRGETAIFDCEIVCAVCGSDLKFAEFAVPCEIAFATSSDGKKAVCDVGICEVNARISAGKVEVFGRICGNLLLISEKSERLVSALVAGEEKPDSCGGFVLYRAENGETLLEVAAAVGVMPNMLKTQNPDVAFPIVGEKKVVVWR